MPNGTLEQRINAQQEKKEEEKNKTPTTSQSVIEEANDALKNSINYGLAAAGGALTTYYFGARAGLSIWGGSVYGDRMTNQLRDRATTSGETRNRGLEATIRAPAVVGGVGALKSIPPAFELDQITGSFLVGAGALFALMPAITALGMATRYTIEKYLPTAKTENKTFKGIKDYFKENYWKRLKQRLPLSAVGSTAIGITYAFPALSLYLFPFLAATRLFYNALIEDGKVIYRRLFYLSTYLPDPVNPVRWAEGLGSLRYKTESLAYRIGSKINDLFKTIPKLTPATTGTAPQPVPATS